MDLMKKVMGREFWESKMEKFEGARRLLRIEQEEGSIKTSLGKGSKKNDLNKERKGRKRRQREARGAKVNVLASANDPHAFDKYLGSLLK